VIDHERALTGEPPHVILTFGGQTAIDLAKDLAYADVPIAGLTAEAIETTEDRQRFAQLLDDLGLEGPRGRLAEDVAGLRQAIEALGLPVIVRPSWVIGGRGIAVLSSEEDITALLATEMDAAARDELVNGVELTWTPSATGPIARAGHRSSRPAGDSLGDSGGGATADTHACGRRRPQRPPGESRWPGAARHPERADDPADDRGRDRGQLRAPAARLIVASATGRDVVADAVRRAGRDAGRGGAAPGLRRRAAGGSQGARWPVWRLPGADKRLGPRCDRPVRCLAWRRTTPPPWRPRGRPRRCTWWPGTSRACLPPEVHGA
jgi:hypothetical protein